MSHLVLKIATGCRFDEVEQRLVDDRVCQAAIVGFDVWVHPASSREALRLAIGADWLDVTAEGNFSIVEGFGASHLVVRWKSDGLIRARPICEEASRLIKARLCPTRRQ